MNIEEAKQEIKWHAAFCEIGTLSEATNIVLTEIDRLSSLLARSQETKRTLAEECERLTERAATHLADQDLLVARERKRVAGECAEIAENHQCQEFADGCGTAGFVARTIRARYGVES